MRKVGWNIFFYWQHFNTFAGVVHATRFNKNYHFSWLAVGPNTKWDWEGARNYCRKFCMDSISIDSVAEKNWVHDLIRKEDLHYIWTGGRKCNFKGCDRKDFQPTIVNGWYWAPTGKRIPAPRRCSYCEWSRTGGLKQRQPDNREQRQGGKEEACIGILNNVYNVSNEIFLTSLLVSPMPAFKPSFDYVSISQQMFLLPKIFPELSEEWRRF